MARGMGLAMSQWDALDEYDRAFALAVDAAPAEDVCPACGGPAAECQDADNQHAYVVSVRRCYRTRAVQDALQKRKSDPDFGSLLVSVTLDPTRKKSANRRQARG